MAHETTVPVEVDGRVIPLTNLDKVLWPQGGFTKAHLIHYYSQMAPVLLPQLKDRPLTVTRWPDGVQGEGFYQKNAPAYAPRWIRTYRDADRGAHRAAARAAHRDGANGRARRERGDASGEPGSAQESTDYILAQDRASLVWLANQACVELHPWLSTVVAPDRPDRIVIDLDPDPPAGFSEARRVAFVVRDVLERMGLQGFPKTSGATGVHVVIPVAPRFPYTDTVRLAGWIARLVADLIPDEATVERRVRDRRGRVYVDYLQNLPGKTIVAAYSVRPLPVPTVSMPVEWEELRDCEPRDFTITTVPALVDRHGDRAAPVYREVQDITPWVEEVVRLAGKP